MFCPNASSLVVLCCLTLRVVSVCQCGGSDTLCFRHSSFTEERGDGGEGMNHCFTSALACAQSVCHMSPCRS